MHVDLLQRSADKRTILNPEMEEYLKKRMMSIMLCTNWVCAGTYEDHEWVSERTIAQHAEEVMGMEMNYDIGIPCVVQWCMLWFSAPTRLNGTLEKQDIKIKQYHEAVTMVITHAILRPFGGEHTPRSCMLASVAKVLHRTHRKWRVNKEMEGWVMRWSLELLPFVDDDDSDECSDECLDRRLRISQWNPLVYVPPIKAAIAKPGFNWTLLIGATRGPSKKCMSSVFP